MSSNRVDTEYEYNPKFALDFPARMNDARQLTDYRSSCNINLPEQDMTTYQYRQYLKHNATKIMKNYTDINEFVSNPQWTDDKCKMCSDYDIVKPDLPLVCEGSQCISSINESAGVGIYYVNNNLATV